MDIITLIIVIAILILSHELGHFLGAKAIGARVDEFGLGYPPRAWGKKFGETLYSINWLPFGGFVKIFGEDPSEEHLAKADKERSFHWKPRWQKAIVIAAGVIFNIILAYILVVYLLVAQGQIVALTPSVDTSELTDKRTLITQILPESPAAEHADLLLYDRINTISVSGVKVNNPTGEEISDLVSRYPNAEFTLSLSFDSGQNKREIMIIPAIVDGAQSENPILGIAMNEFMTREYGIVGAVVAGVPQTIEYTKLTAVAIGGFFADIFKGQPDLSNVAGPVGLYSIVGNAASRGFNELIFIMATISISLAIINLLPIPALDGGRLLFLLIEKIKGSPIKESIANGLNLIGFAFLILLMLFITASDIYKLF